MVMIAYPSGIVRVSNGINMEEEGEPKLEPQLGLEFDSADDACKFYGKYATNVGFRIRIGQLYRSRNDGSVSWRRFVCSKEGFQLNSRTGCPAFIRVQRRNSGKWVIDQIHKDHNHELGAIGESHPLRVQRKRRVAAKSLDEGSQALTTLKLSADGSGRAKNMFIQDVDDGRPCPSGVINVKRIRRQEGWQVRAEPYVGLMFNSADDAYYFYQDYGQNNGFKIRNGQLFRSTRDGSITSRRFVCSKEGFQHPSRVGCGAFMRIKRQDSGTWIVDRLQKNHNHDLDVQNGNLEKDNAASRTFVDDVNCGLDSFDVAEINNSGIVQRTEINNIGHGWYPMLLDYFQSRQAVDTGFFYALEVDCGNCRSIFWADGRSRFSCSQFGDTIVLDTSYRKGSYSAPLAIFFGINHHKQPALFACALIAQESEETFSWLFRTWLRAMSGCRPKSIIADQDVAIQQAIAQVFPGTHHRFSLWQIQEREQENFRLMGTEFKHEYQNCAKKSQTTEEFSNHWYALVNKYGLQDNAWITQMYLKKANWVPLYLRGIFFAGIPLNEDPQPFFGTYFNAQIPIEEFIERYEQGLEHCREEERKEDIKSTNILAFLQTKEPLEEQCRKLYTHTVFKAFHNELRQCYNFLVLKTYEEGTISRYSVRKCGNEAEKHAVTFNSSNLNAACNCEMFEFEGLLCRHILRVFNLFSIREIPSHYILHRWTRSAEYGSVRDVDSGVSSQSLKASMIWSLRDMASKYVECGTTSVAKYNTAFETMREGIKKLGWPG